MTDDLRDRLTAALMDAMECKDASLYGPGNCRRHATVLLAGPKHMGWPCPVAVDYAEVLAPFVRDEIADALDAANVQMTETLRFIWKDPKDREVVDSAEELLTQRAEEVRRG